MALHSISRCCTPWCWDSGIQVRWSYVRCSSHCRRNGHYCWISQMCKVSRFEGFPWFSMVFPWFSMVFHGFPPCFFGRIQGYNIIFQDFPYGIGHSPMIFQHHLTFLAAGGELFRDFRRISSSCAETPGGAPAPHYNKP